MLYYRKAGEQMRPFREDSYEGKETVIHDFCEKNLPELFDLQFIKKKFRITENDGKVHVPDTLAYNEKANSFVIIEYKSYTIKNLDAEKQAENYMHVMDEHRLEFAKVYRQETKDKDKEDDHFNWENARFILVAPSFDKKIVDRINSNKKFYGEPRWKPNLVEVNLYSSTPMPEIEGGVSIRDNRDLIVQINWLVKNMPEVSSTKITQSSGVSNGRNVRPENAAIQSKPHLDKQLSSSNSNNQARYSSNNGIRSSIKGSSTTIGFLTKKMRHSTHMRNSTYKLMYMYVTLAPDENSFSMTIPFEEQLQCLEDEIPKDRWFLIKEAGSIYFTSYKQKPSFFAFLKKEFKQLQNRNRFFFNLEGEPKTISKGEVYTFVLSDIE